MGDVAAALAAVTGRPVIAAAAAVLTTTARAVTAQPGVDGAGRPAFAASQPGGWLAFWPGGGAAARLGPELPASLPAAALAGPRPGPAPRGAAAPAAPARAIVWAPASLPDQAALAGDRARRQLAGPGGSPVVAGAAGAVLSEAGLREAAARLAAGPAAGRGSLGWCAGVVRGLVEFAYGSVRVAGVVDDGVAGLGGVAGVRQGVVAGPGWGRVGSWAGLEAAVAAAGPGAGAAVLVSFAGDRAGHAVALFQAVEGLRWVDPDGGVVDAGAAGAVAGPGGVIRPGAVGRAVAAWAVLIGGDGRVAGVPGGWAGPESAAAAGALADPPVRHDFGAMGVEIERHNVRLFRPSGQRLRTGVWLVRSRHGEVKMVADGRPMPVSDQGVVYDSAAAMERAGQRPVAGIRDGGIRPVLVPEIVTVPWQVLDEPGRPGMDEVLAMVRALNDRLDSVRPDRRYELDPAAGHSLAELFAGSGFVVNEEFADVRVAGLAPLFKDAPLYVQMSVGVPLGGGVLAALTHLQSSGYPGTLIAAALASAMRFGRRVAAAYRAAVPAPGWAVAEAVMVTEVMALAFIQAAGVLVSDGGRSHLMKTRMPVVARQDLASIRAALPPGVRAFLEDHADRIRGMFEQDFGPELDPGGTGGLAVRWDLSFLTADRAHEYTVRDVLDQVLRPVSGEERIDLYGAFQIGGADSGGLDLRGGDGLPLVVLEVRELPRPKYPAASRPDLAYMADEAWMREVLGRLAGAARLGNAAAETAWRLPGSVTGDWVAARLRDAAAPLSGAARRQAVAALQDAAGWHVGVSPGDAAGLEMVFGWFGVPGAAPVPLMPGLGVPRPYGAPVSSGRVFLARGVPGVPDDGPDEVTAALSFPPVDGATVVHVRGVATAGGTQFTVDDQVVTASTLAARIAALDLRAGEPVILVASGAGPAVAAELAGLLQVPVVAATGDAWTIPDGRVLVAGASLAPGGEVVPGLAGQWVAGRPGQVPIGLGGDLAAAVTSGVLGWLAGTPVGITRPAAAQPPARAVPWGAGSAGVRAAGPAGAGILELPAAAAAAAAAAGADLAQRAQGYLSGDPARDLDAGALAGVVTALLAGPAGVHGPHELAVRLLRDADDSMLAQLFAGGRLAGVLEAWLPRGEGAAGQLRADLESFYQRRFGVAQREMVAAQSPQPQPVHPAVEFRPALIDARLDGWPVTQPLTREEARAVLGGRRNAQLREALAGLPPVQHARAGWWVRQARQAAGWAGLALEVLAGDPAAVVTGGRLQELVTALVTGLPGPDEQWLALQLLRGARSTDLKDAFRGGELLGLLDESIPADSGLRAVLDGVLQARFDGGREWLAQGLVYAAGLDGTFSPGLLGSRLEGLALDAPLDDERVRGRIAAALQNKSARDLVRQLEELPAVERARAAWWLTGVRVALHDHGTTPPQAMATADAAVQALYRQAALDVPDAERLSVLTAAAPAAQAPALREALGLPPAPGPVPAPPGPVPGAAASAGRPAQPPALGLAGADHDFRARLEAEYRGTIRYYASQLVEGRRGADRVPERLFPMEHMARIGAWAKQQTDLVYGHLRTSPPLIPARPGRPGNINDLWADRDQKIRNSDPAQRRELARVQLTGYLTMANETARLAREHGAAIPHPGADAGQQNQATAILGEVIEDLLNDEEANIVGQVLDIYRGWPGAALAESQYIGIQLFRAGNPEADQNFLWDTAQTFIHEYLHLLEHPRYQAYRNGTGFRTRAFNALVEGVVSLLTEVVWSGTSYQDWSHRAEVEGDYARSQAALPPEQMPHPSGQRYPSMTEVMRLLHLLGGDVRRLYAAFFLGQVEKILGPVSVAVVGSPQAPLPGWEVAALVARAIALPPATREGIRISVFSDAEPEEIEAVLADPGAGAVSVWTLAGDRALRKLAGPGGSPVVAGAAGAVLSEAGLREAAARLAAGPAAGRGSLGWCAGVVRGLVEFAYGSVRVAGVVDDGVAGLGGVAGVRQGVVAGPGWGRVGSWAGLEAAVAAAGPGAGAAVLVSFAGDRAGHAVALFQAVEGLRWVDPDGGVVDAGAAGAVAGPGGVIRPGAVGRAVAAWAVLIGGDGRVAGVPGGWSAVESGGGVGALADPPARREFGAMGVEIERHDVRLFRSSGEPIDAGAWIARSPDRLVKLYADGGRVWVSDQGVVYGSPSAMQEAGEAPRGSAEDPADDGKRRVYVPEIVTNPWRVLDEPDRPGMDEMLARIRELNDRLNKVTADRRYALDPEAGMSLADVFPGYHVRRQFADVRVVRLASVHEDAPLYVQPSVGVPLGGGVLAVLNHLVSSAHPGTRVALMLGPALRFARRVADGYRHATRVDGRAANWVADTVTVTEVMALAFIQVAGVLNSRGGVAYVMKTGMPVVARHDLAEIREELPAGAQEYLEANADGIRGLFAEEFGRVSGPVDWYMWFENTDRTRRYPVGLLLEQVLRPFAGTDRISQEEVFQVGPADRPIRPDSGEGGGLPLVVLEIRQPPRLKYSAAQRPDVRYFVDDRWLDRVIGELARTVRWGNAAAEFARRLPGSDQGQMVEAGLWDALAAANRAGRDGAVATLRRASVSYLNGSRGDGGALEMMFSWFGMPDGVPVLIPELGVPRPYGSPIWSGRLFLARGVPGVADDTEVTRNAALSFPPVRGATVLYVHAVRTEDPTRRTEGSTHFMVDDQVLTPEQFANRVRQAGLPAGQVVIIVACHGVTAARELAGLLRAPVVAANTAVSTMRDGTVVAAEMAVTDDGAQIPVLGEWMLVRADQDAEPVSLGPNLLVGIRSGVLDQHLSTGLVIGQAPVRVLPAAMVRWSGTGSTGHEHQAEPAGPSGPDPVLAVLAGAAGSDFGAMGVEVERDDVRLLLPDGEMPPEGEVLAGSLDGAVAIRAGAGRAWRGADGRLYESRHDMRTAGVEPAEGMADPDGLVVMSAPRVVTPWQQELAGPGRPDADAALVGLRAVVDAFGQVSQDGTSLAELLGADYFVPARFRAVRVARGEGPSAGAPVRVRLSGSVALGGGVLAGLTELQRGLDPGSAAADVVAAAVRLGWRVARRYGNWVSRAAVLDGAQPLLPGWDVADVIAAAEAMALVFVTLAGEVGAAVAAEGGARPRMPVVSRSSLAEIWAALGPRLRSDLAEHARSIRDAIEAEFGEWFPRFAARYAREDAGDDGARTLSRFLGQLAEVIGAAGSGGPGRGDGAGLARVELDMLATGPVGGVAGRGEAAARFAWQLPASLEGQLVVAWLRQAAAEPPGEGRDHAVRRLRQAAGWYLGPSRAEAGVLEMTLGLVARGLGVPVGFGAADLSAAVPVVLPGRWAQAAGRYESAYEAVRSVARGLALPPVAVRALVGELAGLGQGGNVAEYLTEVLGDQEILGLLRGISGRVPGRGGAVLMVLVNDLLVAASLVPVWETQARGAGTPGVAARPGAGAVELVSPRVLVEVLREVSQGLDEGRGPLAGPLLAGTGYRAGDPLAVRLARLGLVNLRGPVRAKVAADPLFGLLLGSPLLGEALLAAGGAQEQFFVNTGAVVAVDQVLAGRVPTIAGLLVAGREVAGWLEARVAEVPAGGGVLERRDRAGLGPARPGRSVGELVRWRAGRARAEFDAIAAEVLAVLDLAGEGGAAAGRLAVLVRRWGRVMEKLGGVLAVAGGSAAARVPVLTRRLGRDGSRVSGMLPVAQRLDRPGRRMVSVAAGDYLAPVNAVLSLPVAAPSGVLADALGSDQARARFWDLVRGEGGVLARTGPDHDQLLYLRAVRRGRNRVFAFSDSGQSGYQVLRLSQITGWASDRAALVHIEHLPAESAPAADPESPASSLRVGRTQPDAGPGAARVEDIEAPLFGLPVQAIVNPTDRTLLGRTGLSGEILSRGGDELRDQINQIYSMGVGPGEAVVTAAPGMAADQLIHVAVPDFSRGERAASMRELRAAYRAAVTLADQLGLDTIAVPAPQEDDPRNGEVPVSELRGAVRDALARTPTTFLRTVYLVQETAGTAAPAMPPAPRPAADLPALARLIAGALPASTLISPPFVPARDAETLTRLRADRAERRADRDRSGRLAREQHLRLLGQLNRALGITAVDVARDGDCFFNSIIELYRGQPERLARQLTERLTDLTERLTDLGGRLTRRGGRPAGWLGAGELTAAGLRDWLADMLSEDFARGDESEYAAFFTGASGGSREDQQAVRDLVVATVAARGYWGEWVGDQIPMAFAHAAGLPMTLVGRRSYHLGPEGLAPEHYIVYTGNHYLGARAARVLPAQEVQPIADHFRAGLPALAPATRLDRYRSIYLQEFIQLRDEFVQWLGVPHPEAETDPRISAAAGAAASAVSYLDRHVVSGLTEESVDAIGEMIDRLAGEMQTLRGAPAQRRAGGQAQPLTDQLSDPPEQPGFGEMRVEVDRLDVQLLMANGWHPPAGEVLLHSSDGLVSVASGRARVWPGPDFRLYESPAARQAAGVAEPERPPADGFLRQPVPVVTVPWQVLADPGRADAALARLRDVVEQLGRAQAVPNRNVALDDSKLLADLFAGSGHVTPGFGGVRVARYETLSSGAPLRVRVSAGVPLGGGVLAALAGWRDGPDAEPAAAGVLTAALRAGWQVAGLLAVAAPGDGQEAPGRDADDVVMAAEVTALAFIQLSRNLADRTMAVSHAAAWMPVTVGPELAEIVEGLGRRLRAFFTDNAEFLSARLEDELLDWFPKLAHRYAGMDPARDSAWDLAVSGDPASGSGSANADQLAAELLSRLTTGMRQSHAGALGGARSLVVLEMPLPGQPGTFSEVVLPVVTQAVRGMTAMARRGAAVADLVRRLPESAEGRVVAARLRQVAAAPQGSERSRAAGLTAQAARWYLDRFPGEGEPLETALRLLARELGVPGRLGAASPRRPQPGLPGWWAEVADRYESAYEVVRLAAPEVALPSVAVRELAGDLAGWAVARGAAGSLPVADFRPEVLGSGDILGLLASIGRALPVRGRAEWTTLLNDLLVAASLVPVRQQAGGDLRWEALVSPSGLADMLRRISQELESNPIEGRPSLYRSLGDFPDTVLRWLLGSSPRAGVFDLVPDGGVDGLDGWSAVELAGRLPRGGASEGDLIRLVVPDGARLQELMADLADSRQRPVLVTPQNAGLIGAMALREGVREFDIRPADQAGLPVPWQVIWPRESREYRHDRAVTNLRLGDAFVLGLRADPGGPMLLHNGRGAALLVEWPEPEHLRALGWVDGQSIVVVAERWPRDELGSRLRGLSLSLRVDVFYRLPSALAGIGAGASQDPLRLLVSEPELFDLLLERNDQRQPGFRTGPGPGRFVPLRPADLREMLPHGAETRLALPDGELSREVAADLARVVDAPVWVTPFRAAVSVAASGRMIARDRLDGEPVPWVQITPHRVLIDEPPWYVTSSGMFERRQGDAIIEFRHAPAGEVYGIRVISHSDYNHVRTLRRTAPAVPSESPGPYFAAVIADPHGPRFELIGFDGPTMRRRWQDLPGLLAAHGWEAGRAIVVACDFSSAVGQDQDRYWEEVTGALEETARDAGVSVYFPGRGSRVRLRYGDQLVVAGGDAPRWERRDPQPGLPARYVQDVAGRLRARYDAGFVSLALPGTLTAAEGEVGAGAASPTAEMMRDRAAAYGRLPSRPLAVFLVDVPLTGDGGIGLVYPAHGESEPGWEVRPASTGDVAELIRRGHYDAGSQVIQFLAAPQTGEQYEVFAREAQQVADGLGRDVYIVDAAGAAVTYHDDPDTFEARRDGQAIAWRLLTPEANLATVIARAVRAIAAGRREAVPPYFEANENGALVARQADRRVQTFANLVTFEPGDVVDAVGGSLDDYQAYEERGGSEPAVVVVPTLEGHPVDSARFPLSAAVAADAVVNLRSMGGANERHGAGLGLDDDNRPVRLVPRPLDGVQPDAALDDWVTEFAGLLGASVYLAEQGRFDATFRDFADSNWAEFGPGQQPGLPDAVPVSQYVVNQLTDLLVPASLADNPVPVPPDGAGPAPGVLPRGLVVEQVGGIVVLPGPSGERPAWVPREPVPAGEVVVVAQSRGDRTVLGLVRPDGAAKGELVAVPPAWMAEIIGSAAGYAPGGRVIFLVPGLGRPVPGVPELEHYVQQVANLLQAPAVAVMSDTPRGGLSEATEEFSPQSVLLDSRADEAGAVRFVVLSADREVDDLPEPDAAEASLEAEVFVDAFSDGSLRMASRPAGDDQPYETHPVSPWFMATMLAPVLAGRPFVITAVVEPDWPAARSGWRPR